MGNNKSLHRAKLAQQDEFYTQMSDIELEMNAYLEYNPDVFRDKVILCNCDDPYESNFFKYFALRFNDFALKKLIIIMITVKITLNHPNLRNQSTTLILNTFSLLIPLKI